MVSSKRSLKTVTIFTLLLLLSPVIRSLLGSAYFALRYMTNAFRMNSDKKLLLLSADIFYHKLISLPNFLSTEISGWSKNLKKRFTGSLITHSK